MRILLFIILMALIPSAFAGTSQCRWDDRTSWTYVQVGYSNQPLYQVYCPSYPNPSSVSWAGWASDYRLIVKYPLQSGLMIFKITPFVYSN